MTIDQKDNLRLRHIVEAAEHIADFIGGVSKEEFEADYEKQSAVVRQIEIIGEAASKMTHEFTEKRKEIDWPKLVGMRHKMIHDYFDVDVYIVWTTAKNNVPPLKEAILKILKNN
jgi:uncharacterized protein with HEPN domain